MKAKKILKSIFDEGLSTESADIYEFSLDIVSDLMNQLGECAVKGQIIAGASYFVYFGQLDKSFTYFPQFDFMAIPSESNCVVYGWLIED